MRRGRAADLAERDASSHRHNWDNHSWIPLHHTLRGAGSGDGNPVKRDVGSPSALRDADGVYYLHVDDPSASSPARCSGLRRLRLGSTSLATNAAGEALSGQSYHPFGTIHWGEGTFPTDFGFTGQRSVPGTGLVFMHARFYIGRITKGGLPMAGERYAISDIYEFGGYYLPIHHIPYN